jgi:hypothetical protein
MNGQALIPWRLPQKNKKGEKINDNNQNALQEQQVWKLQVHYLPH